MCIQNDYFIMYTGDYLISTRISRKFDFGFSRGFSAIFSNSHSKREHLSKNIDIYDTNNNIWDIPFISYSDLNFRLEELVVMGVK